MANLKLCDLCNGKVKVDFVNMAITGRIQAYVGDPPPPPEGFKYQETPNEMGVKFKQVWDSAGRLIVQMNLMPKPPKWKNMQVNYDLCEECAQRFVMILEQMRQRFHIEQKEVKRIYDESDRPKLPFFQFDMADEDDDE